MTLAPTCVIPIEGIGREKRVGEPPKISIRQLKAARELVGWSQQVLADRSGVSLPTIQRLEAAGGELGGFTRTREKIAAALQGAGVMFIAGDGGGPGVRLR
jgi:transcriptional regulator with XRE-family HTH domain